MSLATLISQGRRTATAAFVIAIASAALAGCGSSGDDKDSAKPDAAATPQPSGAALSVEPATDLDPAGADVAVTGKGYEAGVGLFIVLCDPSVPKGGACDMANFKQVMTDAGGGFTAQVKVLPQFGEIDCMKTPCGIQTSKVGDGANRTQERTVPVGFKGGVAPVTGWDGVGGPDHDPATK